MLNLSSRIEDLPRTSKKILPALKKLGIRTARDLLFHFPSRYEDFSNRKNISEIAVGEVVSIQGRIQKIKNLFLPGRRLTITEVIVEDETGRIKAVWFNQPFLTKNLKEEDIVSLSGKLMLRKQGTVLSNPAYEKIKTGETTLHTGRLVAVYPETSGVSSRWFRFLIKSHSRLIGDVSEILPLELRKKYALPEIKKALRDIHFPQNISEAEAAQKRFIFEELLLLQLHALKEKMRLKQNKALAVKLDLDLLKQFVASLPYKLTDAQRRAIWEIAQDIAKPHPMNRILEGDVGSGKTVVAAAVSLLAVQSGFKVALMAPTEILARQHFETLQKVLEKFDIKIGLLTGSEKKAPRNTEIIVGTHALIAKKINFENLGLIIIDEQHRFGVEQRARLVDKKEDETLPHFLSMSATPIPRTLALTIYGDLDLSILDEMPKSRKEIITKIIEPRRRNDAYGFIRQEVKKGRQAFVVCPRIEMPENKTDIKNFQQKLRLAELKAVTEEYQKLSGQIFPDLKVGMLHGKLKPQEKSLVMRDFQKRNTDILVSTSVIEVGVDIPNATIMMIEGAERFGLAQLHQFRGRVGRGGAQSYCFLFPTEDGQITRRLRAIVDAKNGFELAEKDLEIRGPGDVFGIRQSGISSAVLLALAHPQLVKEIRTEAVELLRKDPTLKSSAGLAEKIKEMEETHLE